MLQSFLTPAGLGLTFTVVVALLGLWGFKYFEPRKTPEQLEAQRKADKEWFAEQWNFSILENAKKREEEIRKACIAEFVLRDEYRKDTLRVEAMLAGTQEQLTRNTLEIEHMKNDIKRIADASERTNSILVDMGATINQINGSWKEWKQQHGPLNGGT